MATRRIVHLNHPEQVKNLEGKLIPNPMRVTDDFYVPEPLSVETIAAEVQAQKLQRYEDVQSVKLEYMLNNTIDFESDLTTEDKIAIRQKVKGAL